ncbi:MAG: AarF/UbiB family protein [Myxococcales bacterium]
MLDECDYRKEAQYQQTFHARFAGHPTIVVPRVFPEASSRRVLTTALEHGRTYHQWLAANPSREERDRAVRALYRFYLGSFYLDGLFNCDPHPGNYLFRDDGHIVFLDYGCCRPFPDDRRRAWIRMALATREDTPEGIEKAARAIGFIPPSVKEFDCGSFRELMRHLYEPYLVDGDYDFALHRPAKTFRTMFVSNPNLFRMDMPRDAVFLNRITFGLVSLMADIGVPHNTYRVANAYFARTDPDWPDDPFLAAEKLRAAP